MSYDCPLHGPVAGYVVGGRAFCDQLRDDPADTGDTCDEPLRAPCAEGCRCDDCDYRRAHARYGGDRL